MKEPLKILDELDIPTSSYIRAVQYVSDHCLFSQQKYQELIQEIIGLTAPPEFKNEKEARLYFKYCVQETVRAFLGGSVPDMDNIWKIVVDRARKWIENNPWAIKDYDQDGTAPRVKRGGKFNKCQEIYLRYNSSSITRKQMIEKMMEECDTTFGSASAFFQQLKTKHGFKGQKTQKRNGKTKHDMAVEVFRQMLDNDKNEIIQAIKQQVNTTDAGAASYYYAIRKQLKESGELK